MQRIPQKSFHITGKEQEYIAKAIQGGHLSGDGPFTKACTSWLETHTKSRKALLTHSCTAALEMAALLCDCGPGDEIIMPSFTFTSTATAFVLRGATPVFVDIDPLTLCIDPACVQKAISPRTKAIVPVHYAGISCPMNELMAIATKNNLVVIEDAAQGVCASYNGQPLGSIGHLGCLSFHETKNIQCGEGGALLINDPRFMERAALLRDKGTNRMAFIQGMVDKYTWVDQGSSYLPNELTAAFLLAQLESAHEISQSRLATFNYYTQLLAPLVQQGHCTLPHIPENTTGNAHILYILTRNLETRMALSAFLKTKNIAAFFHYIPLHSSPAGQRFGKTHGSLPHTNAVAERLLRLPLHANMPKNDVERVVEHVTEFFSSTCTLI